MAAKYVPFFESFWRATRDLSDARRLKVYDAVLAYGFAGEFPDFDGDETLRVAFDLMVPNIEAAMKRCERNQRNISKRWDSKG